MTDTPVKRLDESAVMITGGSSGIGLAAALAFAAAGAPAITLVGRSPERGEAARAQVAAAAPDAQVTFLSGDATDPADVQRLADEAHGVAGRIDVLVNSAGGSYPPDLLLNVPLAEVLDVFGHEAHAPILVTRAVLPSMVEQGGGVIVNVASDGGKTATPGETLVGAAMAAVIMFTRTVAIEAKRSGIRANCITPSLVEGTAGTERLFDHPFASKLFTKARQSASLGVPDAEDQAQLILFLASPAAARLTGQAISVNGGISAA